MSGKCRPSLRRKTLEKLELCVKLHQISITDYECVKVAFERLEEYEEHRQEERCEFCEDGHSFIGAEILLGNDSEWHTIKYCPNCGAKFERQM